MFPTKQSQGGRYPGDPSLAKTVKTTIIGFRENPEQIKCKD